MTEETKEFTIRLTSPMLGTVPKDKELYASYVAGKVKDPEKADEEIATVEEVEEKGWTGFHQNGNGLFIYDYMIKGFLKAACESLMATGDIKKISAYKKWFDLMVFVRPREINLNIKEPDGMIERPIRVMVPKGPRTSLVRSDFANAGREIKFDIALLKNTKGINWDVIEACLDYGKYVGLGQWRGSGGYGQFEVCSGKAK